MEFLLQGNNSDSGTNHWTQPPLEFVEVNPIKFPDEYCSDADELVKQCKTVQTFIEASILSLELIQSVEPSLYRLELYVVRQYFLMVGLRFQECVHERAKRQKKSDAQVQPALIALNLAIKKLRNLLANFWPAARLSLSEATAVAKEWLSMTIFHPVFAALASKFDLWEGKGRVGERFAEHVRSTQTGDKWYHKTRELRPAAILMNFTDQMVATSVPRWPKRGTCAGRARKASPTILQLWEKEVRVVGMGRKARELLERTRFELLPFSVHNDLAAKRPWAEVFAAGTTALEEQEGSPTPFARVCRGKVWLTVEGSMLRHFDQCPACRIKYAAVLLPVANTAESAGHEIKLGKNWGRREYWSFEQCAEDEMFSKLARLSAPPDCAPDAGVVSTVLGFDAVPQVGRRSISERSEPTPAPTMLSDTPQHGSNAAVWSYG